MKKVRFNQQLVVNSPPHCFQPALQPIVFGSFNSPVLPFDTPSSSSGSSVNSVQLSLDPSCFQGHGVQSDPGLSSSSSQLMTDDLVQSSNAPVELQISQHGQSLELVQQPQFQAIKPALKKRPSLLTV